MTLNYKRLARLPKISGQLGWKKRSRPASKMESIFAISRLAKTSRAALLVNSWDQLWANWENSRNVGKASNQRPLKYMIKSR